MQAGFGRALFCFIYEVEEEEGAGRMRGMAMVMAEGSTSVCWRASRT